MTGEKMCQEVLNAYINRNSKNKVQVSLSKFYNGDFDATIRELTNASVCSINICNFYSDDKNKNNFEKMIAVLKGEISLFDEKSNEYEED